jgi:hypothetical protein
MKRVTIVHKNPDRKAMHIPITRKESGCYYYTKYYLQNNIVDKENYFIMKNQIIKRM